MRPPLGEGNLENRLTYVVQIDSDKFRCEVNIWKAFATNKIWFQQKVFIFIRHLYGFRETIPSKQILKIAIFFHVSSFLIKRVLRATMSICFIKIHQKVRLNE